MAEMTDVIHVVNVNRYQTGVGDGRSRLFPIRGENRNLTPTNVNAVFTSDWQAALSQMVSYQRTNYIPYSFDFRSPRWTPLWGKAVVQVAPTLTGPDGVQGRVSFIRLGDCTSNASGQTGGMQGGAVIATNPGFPPNGPVAFSVWLRADVAVKVNLVTATTVVSDSAGLVDVDTVWRRYTVTATVGAAGHERLGQILISRANNVGVSLDTLIYMVYAQAEQQIPLGTTPSRMLITDGLPITAADYRVSDGNFLTTEPLTNGAPLLWTGTGYWLESANPYVVAPLNLLSAVTWRFDQSENLLALLRAKQQWYDSNHTQFWDRWNTSIFTLDDANTFGVAVWAFILNVPLESLSLRDRYRFWAFGPTRENFTSSASGPQNPSSGNFPPLSQNGAIATPREKIQSLRLKYYALISDCSIASINAALADVFEGSGMAYVLDNEDMTMTYVFDFPISAGFRQSMVEYDLLPKPAGVKITITAP